MPGLGLGLGLNKRRFFNFQNFSSFGTLVNLYDFTRPSTLYTDTGRTSSVASDGDVIAGVTDLAAGTYPLSQTDGTATPLYKTNILNGRSVARFDGVNDFLQTATSFGTNAGLSGNPAFSVFCVARKTTAAKGMIYGWGATGTGLRAAGHYDDGTFFGFGYAGANFYNFTGPTNNSWFLHTATKSAGAINTTSAVRRNGSSVATGTPSGSTPNINGAQSLALGRWADYTGVYLAGDIALLAVYSGVVSNVSAVESFINSYVGGIY